MKTGFFFTFLFTLSLQSCHTTVVASSEMSLDTNRVDLPVHPVYLMDKLDSLKKNLIVFPPLDSINLIDPKIAKRTLRDSIYKELAKKPKHIYLTFDDGPLIGSSAIDSIATSKGIKISAFVVGKHVKMSKRLTRDFERYVNNPLVEVYNHSFSHANQRYETFYRQADVAFDDFVKAQNAMGLQQKIARLPGRNIWRFDDVSKSDGVSGKSTADLLFQDGYKVFGWDVEWRVNGVTGVPLQSVEATYNSVKNFLEKNISMFPNNVVLLMHDDMFQNKKGQKLLSELIDYLKQNPDYRFEFMSDYPIKY